MYLIVGLGNPGHKFSGTRHNVGFKVISELAEELGITETDTKFKSLLGRGKLSGDDVILAQPLTYMNKSGLAVKRLVENNLIKLENILIIYDDLDLPPGKIRIKKKGGSGGHNGLQSIIDKLGSEKFPRLRIGIGRPPAGVKAADYVLQEFSGEEKKLVNRAIEEAIESIKVMYDESIIEAMNRYN
ncbi:MAG: aminoacyl-tRNA hydrolase [Halanaerobiales bacterium]